MTGYLSELYTDNILWQEAHTNGNQIRPNTPPFRYEGEETTDKTFRDFLAPSHCVKPKYIQCKEMHNRYKPESINCKKLHYFQ